MTGIEIYYTRIINLRTESIPKRIGAYIMTHTPDNVHAEKYIGSTRNLYNRMHSHNDKKVIYIDIYITDNIELAHSLERILMELIRPATNIKISPLSDNDKVTMKELLEDTNIKDHTLDNIIKIGFRHLKYIIKNDIEYTNNNENTKSIHLTEETHNLLIEKQKEIHNKTNINISLSKLANIILYNNLKNFEPEMILKSINQHDV